MTLHKAIEEKELERIVIALEGFVKALNQQGYSLSKLELNAEDSTGGQKTSKICGEILGIEVCVIIDLKNAKTSSQIDREKEPFTSVLYEGEIETIRHQRFFEVAEYLERYGLWGRVEQLLKDSRVTGDRIYIDTLLANAAKLAVQDFLNEQKEIDETHGIAIDLIKCGGKRPPRRNGGGVRG